MTDEVSLLREYVETGKLLQLATQGPEGPWVVHLWYASSRDLKFYFISNKSRGHSAHIRAAPTVSLGVLAIDLEGLGQTVRGLSVGGVARELTKDRDIREGLAVYAKRWPNAFDATKTGSVARWLHVTDKPGAGKAMEAVTPMRVYEVEPTKYVLFDELNFPDSPRREISRQRVLDSLRSQS